MPVKKQSKKVTKKKTHNSPEQRHKILMTVMDKLSALEPRPEIVRYISEKYKIGERQVENYMHKARELMREALAGTEQEYREMAVQRVRRIKELAYKGSNKAKRSEDKARMLKVMLNAERELNRILIPDKHNHTVTGANGEAIKVEHRGVPELDNSTGTVAAVLKVLADAGAIPAPAQGSDKAPTK